MTEFDRFLMTLGLKKKFTTRSVLANGVEAERFTLQIGLVPQSFSLIDCSARELTQDFLEDLKKFSSFERVILLLGYSDPHLRSMLKENRIGYFDKDLYFYLPLDITGSSDSELIRNALREVRPISKTNEFFVGFMLYKNFGLLERSQTEIGRELHKSAATINFILKAFVHEGVVSKVPEGYKLISPEKYFDRWRIRLQDYSSRRLIGRFRFEDPASPDEIRSRFSQYASMNRKFAYGGPFADAEDGYLTNATKTSIYLDQEKDSNFRRKLNLVNDVKGDIHVYQATSSLAGEKGRVPDALLAAELLNDEHPRVVEAGEERKKKYFDEYFRRDYERFGKKHF